MERLAQGAIRFRHRVERTALSPAALSALGPGAAAAFFAAGLEVLFVPRARSVMVRSLS
jgi:hypothetical protein